MALFVLLAVVLIFLGIKAGFVVFQNRKKDKK